MNKWDLSLRDQHIQINKCNKPLWENERWSHMIIQKKQKNYLTKIQLPLIITDFNKPNVEWKHLNIIKAIYNRLTA